MSASPFPQISNPNLLDDLSSPSPTPSPSLAPALLHLSFNQDDCCFASGTENGFRIYNCDPFHEIFRHDFDRAEAGSAPWRCSSAATFGTWCHFFYAITLLNAARLDSEIIYDRDFDYDYFGFKTLERSYLLKLTGKVVERPQHMLMRVSVGIHKDDIDSILKT